MEQYEKERLLTDLKAESKYTRHQRGLRLAESGDYEGFILLKSELSNPPRLNSPEYSYFEEALSGVIRFLTYFLDTVQESDLNDLAGLENIYKDVIYYLEDDPLYDVGHDSIHADFSKVRELAKAEINSRTKR